MFLHFPPGVENARQLKGVMAVPVVARDAEGLRELILKHNAGTEDWSVAASSSLEYADAHQMASIVWGARPMRDAAVQFDESDYNKESSFLDAEFPQVAAAWEKAVDHWVATYGIPDHNFLIEGSSAGGVWTNALVLNRPDRFLAAHCHIAGIYAAPVSVDDKPFWLITTGELDFGCDRARRFYAALTKIGYPAIFKAYVGVGHSDVSSAYQLGARFFDYALGLEGAREKQATLSTIPKLDVSSFANAPFYGDLMNQDMFAAQDKQMIPPGFLVPLPTKEIADAWDK